MKGMLIRISVTVVAAVATPLFAEGTYDQGFAAGYHAGYTAGYELGSGQGIHDVNTPFSGGETVFRSGPDFLAVTVETSPNAGANIQMTPKAIPLYGEFDFESPAFWKQLQEHGAAKGWQVGDTDRIAIVPWATLSGDAKAQIDVPIGTGLGLTDEYVSGPAAAFERSIRGVNVLRDAPMIGSRGLQLVRP